MECTLRAFLSSFFRSSKSGIRKLWLALALVYLLVNPAVSGATTCSEVVGFGGITFTFDQPYTCGRFITGDPWVLEGVSGDVMITGITPSATGSRNGWQVNPLIINRNGLQSLDSRMRDFDDSLRPALPYAANTGESILKIISEAPPLDDPNSCTVPKVHGAGNTRTCVRTAAILTVLDTAPTATAFRPPYVSTWKPMYDSANVDPNVLPNVPEVTDQIPWEDALHIFGNGGPWLDHFHDFRGRRIHPRDSMRTVAGKGRSENADYGAEISKSITTAIMRTMHPNLDNRGDEIYIIRQITQVGIDLYGMLKAGQFWVAGGGHGQGRKLPILYAGFVMNDPNLLRVGLDHLDVNDPNDPNDCSQSFQEDGHTYYGAESIALFGTTEGGCDGTFGGNPAWQNHLDQGCSGGKKDARDPDGLRDGGHQVVVFPGDVKDESCTINEVASTVGPSGPAHAGDYQECCTSGPYKFVSVVARLLGLRGAWAHEPFFDYVTRWAAPPYNGGGGYSSNYMREVFNAYDSCANSCSCPGQICLNQDPPGP